MESYCEEQARLARMCRTTAEFSPEQIEFQRNVVKAAKQIQDCDKAIARLRSVGWVKLTDSQRDAIIALMEE
jgi:hypothetical protein